MIKEEGTVMFIVNVNNKDLHLLVLVLSLAEGGRKQSFQSFRSMNKPDPGLN